jgi:hypothetical protein
MPAVLPRLSGISVNALLQTGACSASPLRPARSANRKCVAFYRLVQIGLKSSALVCVSIGCASPRRGEVSMFLLRSIFWLTIGFIERSRRCRSANDRRRNPQGRMQHAAMCWRQGCPHQPRRSVVSIRRRARLGRDEPTGPDPPTATGPDGLSRGLRHFPDANSSNPWSPAASALPRTCGFFFLGIGFGSRSTGPTSNPVSSRT